MPPAYDEDLYEFISNYTYDYDPSQSVGNAVEYAQWVFIGLVLFPVGIIVNLVLFAKIVGTKKIKGDPWRWLVAHTSFCKAVMCFLGTNQWISYIFKFPLLLSGPMCSAFLPIWYMFALTTILSVILLAIERLHALNLGKEEGGLSKTAVIISLVIFWISSSLFVLVPVISTFLRAMAPVMYDFHQMTCILESQYINLLIHLGHVILALLSFLVITISTLVLRRKKETTDDMKKWIAAPTLALSSTGLLLLAVPAVMEDTLVLLTWTSTTSIPYIIVTIIVNIIRLLNPFFMIAFPIIWLVTWSQKGDISWNCGRGTEAERKNLLNAN